VRNDETTLRLYLDDLALVLVSPSLVFTLPDNCAAWLPVGFHLGPEHVPLYLGRISQGRPHPCGRSDNVGLCGRNDPGHGSSSSWQAGAPVVAVSRTTAPFDEPYVTAGTIQPEGAGATVPAGLIDR